MPENKTKQTEVDPEEFLKSVTDDKRREDALALLRIMKSVTKMQPKMWGPSMVGFGTYHYKYDSGREGDSLMTGFSPRKQNLAVYIMAGLERYDALLKKLGKHKTGKSCLYISKLEDIDQVVLKELLVESLAYMKKQYEWKK